MLKLKSILQPALLSLVIAASGCSLNPSYQTPSSPVSSHWPEIAADKDPGREAKRGYQAFISDPKLLNLVGAALANNRTLRQTMLDIEAARAQYRIQRADRAPGLSAGASANREHMPADLSSTGAESVAASYRVGLTLPEYELDLFGRINSLTAAALEQYLATEQAAQSAKIALVADTAQSYLGYKSALQQLAYTRQTLESRETSLALVQQQVANGTATALDYQEARSLVEQAKGDLESIDRQVRQTRNALVLLVGRADAANLLPSDVEDRVSVVQELAPGSPSELITHRPDIVASEHVLRSRNANIGAARAAFFPRISLTGSFGTASADMSNLFDGGSRSWSFVPVLSVPVFDAGRTRANLDLARVRKDAAVAEYEQTIQTAFREVADALAGVDTLGREVRARAELANAGDEAVTLAKARYIQGVDSHLRLLEAERSSFNNHINLIKIRTEQQTALVSLYRALGGTWY